MESVKFGVIMILKKQKVNGVDKMKKLIKNIIAICISVSSLFTCYSVSAESTIHTEWDSETETDNLTVVSGSGLCGDSMKWALDSSGILTISGSGEMYSYFDFSNDSAKFPWFQNNNAIAIQKIVIENGVESISDMAFYGTSITSLELPDSVKKIGISSFANCQNLKTAVLSNNITEIPEGAFNCDGKLEAVVLSSKLKSIGKSAFIHCYKLNNIVIPETVTDIKDMAFFDCTLLNEVVIPDEITTIKRGSFESCDALKRVIFSQNITKIEESAFSNCANIEEIILPDGLTEIGQNAFSYSNNDRDPNLTKQKVYVPKSVQIIDKNGIDSDSVIYGFKESVAEKYAAENNIEFVEVTESLYDNNSYDAIKENYYSQSVPIIEESITQEPTMSVLTVYSGKTITVSIDGNTVNFPDAQPFIDENNRTQIPISIVSEMLNSIVDWDNNSRTVTITQENGDIIKLVIESPIMTYNGKNIQMDTAAVIKDGRTYIPVRFVAEAMGLTVEWQK